MCVQSVVVSAFLAQNANNFSSHTTHTIDRAAKAANYYCLLCLCVVRAHAKYNSTLISQQSPSAFCVCALCFVLGGAQTIRVHTDKKLLLQVLKKLEKSKASFGLFLARLQNKQPFSLCSRGHNEAAAWKKELNLSRGKREQKKIQTNKLEHQVKAKHLPLKRTAQTIALRMKTKIVG